VSPEDLLARLAATADALAAAVHAVSDDDLRRRPESAAWSAIEIVCHLRDVDELFQVRFHTILAVHEPAILVFGASLDDLAAWRIGGAVGHPLDPERWAEDRQYRRADAAAALCRWRSGRPDSLVTMTITSISCAARSPAAPERPATSDPEERHGFPGAPNAWGLGAVSGRPK
jgi:hypothetical protein